MCGIAGIFTQDSQRPIDRDLLTRMNNIQSHRGPDEQGLHIAPGVGLAHRRLSIIDLSTGQQPLYNEDRAVVIVFNGEIFNFQALSEELKHCGHQFRTHSDTEVIVHAWEEWGAACVKRFRGMFAFAIWDEHRQQLFLARDRLGIKPLYYALLSDGQFIFGSELKVLLTHPGIIKNIDPLAVEDYFAYGYIPEPKTILQNVYKLSPGHSMIITRERFECQPSAYWDIPFQPVAVTNEQDAAVELIERLKEAVKIRLIAEVPLGAFLSGGVDSSAIVALMAQSSAEPINTCSISFGDPKFNESQYAAQVATQFKTHHTVEQVDPEDFSLIDQLAFIYDEPFADSSAIPTYRVCQLARKKVTVALSGDGGDENFAGYRRYRWHMYEEKVRSRLPLSLRRPLFGMLGRLYPKLDWAPRVLRAKSTFEALARDSVGAYFHTVSVMPDAWRAQLFSSNFKRQLQGYQAVEVLRRHARQAPSNHPLSLVQYLDMKTYLPGDILTKVDRASMIHGLEVRVPLLDHLFIEWVSGLPPEWKLRGQEGKSIFKKSLEPYLPANILYRDKMGFSVPLANWFRGPLKQRVRDAILGPRLLGTGMFNDVFLRHIVTTHQAGIRDYSAAIWALLMFEAFIKNTLQG